MAENNINSMNAEELVLYLGIDSQLAVLLEKHKPYAMPEDALRVAGIVENASLTQLQRILELINESVGGIPPEPIETNVSAHEKAGMVYGIKRYKGDVQRIFIASQFNFELLSAEIDTGGEINLSTLRVLSRLPYEFIGMENETLLAVSKLTVSPLYANASLLAPYYELSGFSRLTLQGISVLADLASTIGATTINGCGPEGFVGINPSFRECCDAHDICYGQGGTEQDRLECDSRLYDCIKALTGPLDPRARIFYILVLSFGRLAFNYKSSGPPIDMDVIATAPAGAGGSCRWDARLMSIEYSALGENIGNFTLDVIRDLEKQMRENPNSIRRNRFPRGTVKYGKTREMNPPSGYPLFWGDKTCGTTVLLPVFFGDSGRGAGQNINLRFVCNGNTYEKTIAAHIDDAVIKFKIRIKTACSDGPNQGAVSVQ